MKRSIYVVFICIFTILTFSNINATGTEFIECDESCKTFTRQLIKFAKNGSPKAQVVLALSYKTGELQGIVDDEQAWKWIRRARKQHYAPALQIMSNWYRIGYHKEIDVERADKYLLKAVNMKHTPAIVDLALINIKNNNFKEGLELLEQAAELGNINAKKLLALASNKMNSKTDINSSRAKSDKQPEKSQQEYPDDEVLTIVADKNEPLFLFELCLDNIRQQGIYNRRGTTGSRLSDIKCGQKGSSCKAIDPNATIDLSVLTNKL